jgi:hypothetical protein
MAGRQARAQIRPIPTSAHQPSALGLIAELIREGRERVEMV